MMIKKILVIGPSWVGDMMMSQALYRALKAENPSVQIDVMAPAWCQPLLKLMPEVNQALDMPIGHGELNLSARKRIGQSLQKTGYDQAIVLPNSFKSALIPFFAKIPKRTGWKGEMRYGLLNDRRTLDKQAFPLMVQRYVALAYDKNRLQSAEDLPLLLPPKLQVSKSDQQAVLTQFSLDPTQRYIGFCPGAEFGPAKRWPDYHYASLGRQLIAAGYSLLIFGSPKDHPVGEAICAQLQRDDAEGKLLPCHNLAGVTTLEQAVQLIAACDAIVSNDSGLMHVAASLDRPLVALYGPSSPDFTPPLSDRAVVIRLITGYLKVRKGESNEGYHQSLIDIQPQHVLERLMAQLALSEKEA